MENPDPVLADKARQASGAVHRPAEAEAEPSNSSTSAPLAGKGETDDQPTDPPPYSSSAQAPTPTPTNRSRSPATPPHYAGLPALDYRHYSPPTFELSPDITTITSRAPHLSQNAAALAKLIRTLATVPPKLQMHVTGTRGHTVDFSIKLNLMPLLVPLDPGSRLNYVATIRRDEAGFRGGVAPALLPHVQDGGLEEWCRRFVDDRAGVKTFGLERVVVNLDTHWLEGQVRSMVAAAGYRGGVDVTFPVTHARVVMQSPDRVNRFFTSVATLFSGGKTRYEVVRAVWPFATCENDEGGDGPTRRCVAQSEKDWWEEWRDPIGFAITSRRRGWVTVEDRLECLMEGKGKGLAMVNWGPNAWDG